MDNAVCTCISTSLVDIIALVVAVGSIIVSIVNVHKYHRLQTESNDLQEKYNAMVNTQTLTGQGALETQVRSAIADAYSSVVSLAVMVVKEPENDFLQTAYRGAEEVYRNAYEDACAKYLDGKIDKDRFKKMYFAEIRRLVEEEPHKDFYANNQSFYDCTVKVYKEWYHLER